MGIAGQASHNVVQQFGQLVLGFVKKKRPGATAPSDGFVLKLHYKYSFYFMLFIFTAVWYTWYHSELLVCAPKFNADAQLRPELINFCSSYMYVDDVNAAGSRRYLFFYKWLHWIGLILAWVCYLPRKLSKSFENPRVLTLLTELYPHRSKYDVNTERNILKKISFYFKTHLSTHNAMYINAVASCVLALLVDGFIWGFLDFVLHGRFSNLFVMTVPFNRDMINFTDALSQTFPPYAQCNIAPQHEMIAERSELYGCHLVLMEFYEKVFVALWVWLVALTLAASIHLIYLLLLLIPKLRLMILRVAKPDFAFDVDDDSKHDDSYVDDLLETIVSKCKIGDIWLLYKLRKNMSPHRYFMLLEELAQPALEVISVDPTVLPSGKDVSPQVMNFIPTIQNNNHPMKQQQHPQSFHPSMMQQMTTATRRPQR